jgi:hypothetical protein
MTEKQYREYKAINYSLLSKLSVSPVGLEEESESADYFTMGSLVDCLCTTPDLFHSQYYVATAPVPSDSMVAYCKELAASGDAQKAWEASGLKSDPAAAPKSGGDSKFKKEAEAYYKDLLQGKGKQVISFEENTKASNLSNILQTNEFTSKYFGQADSKYQYPIIWKYYGQECKCLFDIIHIDHERGTIRPMDLKTTGKSVFSFPSSYINYRYYIQAAFYTAALEYALENDPDFQQCKGYTVLPFTFIVIETNYKNPPHLFEVDKDDLVIAEEGGTLANSDREIKGFKHIIEDLEYHKTTNQWEYKQEVYANDGVISLKALASIE